MLLNCGRKRKKRIPANQDVTDCLPKLFEPSIVAVSVHEKKTFLFAIFQKKQKIICKKAESEKKKSGIPPKSGRLTSLCTQKTVTSYIKMRLVFSFFAPSREGL